MSLPHQQLIEHYTKVRAKTAHLVSTLSAEDMQAQSMPDASPVKWHLAHTTWFFETFILKAFSKNYALFDESFPHLFNSYYESAGTRHARPQRGLLTRPSLQEVQAYRAAVDGAMHELMALRIEDIAELVTIGLHHEMQHQELILTDVLHLLSHHPCFPVVFPSSSPEVKPSCALQMIARTGDMARVGALDDAFSYDCEGPNHLTYVSPHALANRLVTNAEWLAFMKDGGYGNPLLWLSDGWHTCQQQQWRAPLYWREFDDGEWKQFGLNGILPLTLEAPVCHVSYYEADAFARWAGKRLPREHELELACGMLTIEGNFVEQACWRPQPASANGKGIQQLYGDVWEWTQSAYSPYPNFKAEQGALGEYNGKFMANQFVLRGGSCATAQAQMRPSYRNFFYPHHRWQFSGVRLAEDLS